MAKSNIDRILEDMANVRNRLADSVEGIVAQTDPRLLKDRMVSNVKGFIRGEINHALSFIRHEDGTWKMDVILRATLVAASTVSGLLVLRRIVRGPAASKRRKEGI